MDNKEFYSEYEKAYREKKQKEEPGYYTAKYQRYYYKLKADPVKWEEYQRKRKEYYQRKKELENGKVI